MDQPVKRRSKKFDITKRKIIEAAQKLSMKNGFNRLTVKAVCQEAGVSVGSFYNCFASFSDMLMEADNNPDRLFAVQAADDLKADTAAGKLIEFAGHYAKLNVDTGVEDLCLLMTPSAKNSQYSRHKPMFDIVDAVLSHGQKSGELTDEYSVRQMRDMLFVVMRGCAYDWCMKNGEYDLVDRTVFHVRILLNALCKS